MAKKAQADAAQTTETTTTTAAPVATETTAPATDEFKPLAEVDLTGITEEFGKPPAIITDEKKKKDELDVVDETDKGDKGEKKSVAKAKEVKTTDKKGAAKKAETDTETKVDELNIESDEGTESKAKDELEIKDTDVPDEEMESSFVSLGEAIGIKVEKDSFEDFKTAYEGQLKTIKETEFKRGQAAKDEDVISTLDPEAQFALKALNAGIKYEEFVNPGSEYDKYLEMSDEDLIVEYNKQRGQTEAKAKEGYAILKENGTDEYQAYSIRQEIQNMKKGLLQKQVQQKEQFKQNLLNKAIEIEKKENQQIVDAIKKAVTYEDLPVSPKALEKMSAKWNNGFYKEKFKNDPEFVVKAIMHYELHQAALEKKSANAKKQGAEEKTEEFRAKLHNTDQLKSETASGKSKEVANQKEGLELMVEVYKAEQAANGN